MSAQPSLIQRFEQAHLAAASQAAGSSTTAAQPDNIGQKFDDIWPKARPMLEALRGFVSYIPGLATAAPVLSGLIAVGDGLVSS
jgi:hypothetical protein